MAASKNPGVKITGTTKFPLVPTNDIRVVDRPEEGEDRLFYNPRSLTDFSAEKMKKLELSVRSDGLQTPLLIRAVSDNGTVVKAELVAGERRLRTLRRIVDEDLPCFDENSFPKPVYDLGEVVLHRGSFAKVQRQENSEVEVAFLDFEDQPSNIVKTVDAKDLLPTVSGKQLYERVECRVLYDISDERALRLAFTENDQSEPLAIADEVGLVERLTKRGMKVNEISQLLGSNPSWVSQTSNFRNQLPAEAFSKLLDGTMTRHAAVHLLSYDASQRDILFERTIQAEEEETKEKIRLYQDEQEQCEDNEEIHLYNAKKAESVGDENAAEKAKKKARSAANKASKAEERKDKAESDSGNIKQSHILEGAKSAGVSPKKKKMLPKKDIKESYVDFLMSSIEKGGVVDEICGEDVPEEHLQIALRTAQGILDGESDPIAGIRDYMVESGCWGVQESTEAEAEVETEVEEEEDTSESLFSIVDDYEYEYYDEEAVVEAELGGDPIDDEWD